MAVRNRMDELEEWCFWHRPQNPQGAVAFSHIGSVSSVPSPEFSDSLDSTITPNRYADSDGNYNSDEQHVLERQLSDENTDKCHVRRNGCTDKNCSTHGSKTVPIDPSPRLLGNNQSVYKTRDSVVLDNSPSRNYEERRKSNDVRRVASSDSIPCGNYNNLNLSQGCRVLSQDCVRRSKSPDVRNTTTLRYIQSAKGTWTYNL